MDKKIFLVLIAAIVGCIAGTFISCNDSPGEPLHLALPKDVDTFSMPKGPIVTLLLMKNTRIYYYEGAGAVNGKTVSLEEIGDMLEEKKKSPDSATFTVVIKPVKDASYKSIVNVLDQMQVHDIKKYALVDISNNEQKLVNNIQ